MTATRSSRQLDFIRFLGLGYSETYKEWHARLQVKDCATAILQTIDVKPGRKPRLLDPKIRSYSFKPVKLERGKSADGQGAFIILEMSDGSVQKILQGQVMLRDAANPDWRFYDAPESDERFDHSRFA